MPRISVLPDTLASQVAAGEVVERPASVLKELVENSLDAGATQIEVEIRKGGVALLKVSDNGHGMDKENALMSLERHATSKLTSSEGLAAIMTHGFRGEALPSIASVARFRLTTNDDPSTPATDINTEGGKVLQVSEVARAKGTTMEVKDIFYNVPARRKFLKSEATEYAHLEHVVRLSALGNSAVRYQFKNNGRLIWDLKPTKDRRTRIADLAGHQVLKDLQEVERYMMGEIAVEGYLLPGRLARGTGKSQTVFINGRPIDDPVIRGAIRDGYHGHIQQGQFPVVWLWITMPPDMLDVNVHPAKREVRFARPTEIKHAIVEAVASTLSPQPRKPHSPPAFLQTSEPVAPPVRPVESVEQRTVEVTPREEESRSPEPVEPSAPAFQLASEWATPDQQEMALPVADEEPQEGEKSAPFSLIGSLQGKYWLMEDENGLVVFDPRAARKRITYEGLKRAYTENTLSAQALLIPLLLELDGHDQAALKAHLPTLHELGIEITSFGGNTFQVQSLPTLLELSESGDAENFVLGVIDQLETTSLKSAKAREKVLEQLLMAVAHQSALTQSADQQFALPVVAELMLCELPYCTPEGKPTMIHYATNEIAKKFGG